MSSSMDRFEKTFSRKKKKESSTTAATKSNNNKTTDEQNKKIPPLKPKSPPPSSSHQKPPPKSTPSSKPPSKSPPKSQPPNKNKNKPSSDQSKTKQQHKKKPESDKRDGNLSKSNKKKKVGNGNVGVGKEEGTRLVVALAARDGKIEKKEESVSKEKKKRKAENGNVGGGKEEVKRTKAATTTTVAGAKNGRNEKKGKEKEEGLECVFPAARISRIVKSEGSDYRLSSEAVFLINKATEKFIGLFSEDAFGFAVDDRKNFVAYKHLSSAVSKGKRFDFLSDFVQEKVTAEKALAARKSQETLPA